jgi:hypothetical protein
MKWFALKLKWRTTKFSQWRHEEGEEYNGQVDRGIYSTNIEYGEFQIKNDIIEGNEIGADNSNIKWRRLCPKDSSIIASGATTIGKRWARPRRYLSFKLFRVEICRWGVLYLSLYSKDSSTITSGATPIGSTERAPDDIYSWLLEQKRWRKIRWSIFTPIGSEFLLSHGYTTRIFPVK